MIHYDSLLQNARTILLQKATKVYQKMRQYCLLQDATILLQTGTAISKCTNSITKWESHYKMRCLLQNALVHSC